MKSILQKISPHIIVILGLYLVLFLYFKPAFEGMRLAQNDVKQAIAAGHEVSEFRKNNGEEALWSNSMFSGMPMYIINAQYSGDWTYKINTFLRNLFPHTIGSIAINFLCAYVMFLCFRLKPFTAAIGAFAYSFSVFTIISAEAGHIYKVLAMGYMPLVIGGIKLVLDKKYLLGGSLTSLAVSLELAGQHPQITYYLAFFSAFFVGSILLVEIINKNYKHVFLSIGILLFAALLGLGPNTARLWSSLEYNPYSTRGKKELVSENKTSNNVSNGLNKTYAFDWSQGIGESFTLAIPNMYGGASGEDIGEKSALYSVIEENFGRKNALNFSKGAPTYWGDQPFTGGPIYVGITVIFLAFAGFLSSDKKQRWAIGTGIVFTLMLAWGKNFEILNYFMFDHFPLFNKFRTVSMALAVVILGIVLLAGIGLNKLIFDEEDRKKLLLNTFIGTLLFTFTVGFSHYLFADFRALEFNSFGSKNAITSSFVSILIGAIIFGGSYYYIHKKDKLFNLLDLSGSTKLNFKLILILCFITFSLTSIDSSRRENALVEGIKTRNSSLVIDKDDQFIQRYFTQVPEKVQREVYSALLADRESMFLSDWFRSIIFVIAIGGLLFIYNNKIIKNKELVLVCVLALLFIDILPIDWKFINHDKFTESSKKTNFRKNKSDVLILNDAQQQNKISYRVHDLNNPFNNSIPSYYHKLVGGYSGLKMQRYQDLIDSTLQKENYLISANINQMQKMQLPTEQIVQQLQSRLLPQLDILNMLNAQYIMADYNGAVIPNNNALGNAWFVSKIKEVSSVTEEINFIKNEKEFDPSKELVVNNTIYDNLSLDENYSCKGEITLSDYQPNKLTYNTNSQNDQVAVFSEVYYPKGWNAYIDGKLDSYFACNYVLRAMKIPSGEHTIEFRFEPKSYSLGNSISRIASILIFIALGSAIFFSIKSKEE